MNFKLIFRQRAPFLPHNGNNFGIDDKFLHRLNKAPCTFCGYLIAIFAVNNRLPTTHTVGRYYGTTAGTGFQKCSRNSLPIVRRIYKNGALLQSLRHVFHVTDIINKLRTLFQLLLCNGGRIGIDISAQNKAHLRILLFLLAFFHFR